MFIVLEILDSEFKKVSINNISFYLRNKYTILQGCLSLKIDIPFFCYHDKLGIAGNCRLCLVDVNSSKKMVVSCANLIEEGMVIITNSFKVIKARESILEFLLLSHPLDCPICDQGGECDLQDLTLLYGLDRGRYYELYKRAVDDKNFGPLIQSFMTRCIHCTRCTRFLQEIAGEFDLGLMSRGYQMEISSFIEKDLLNELSGNIIDLCPVGALTAKPYAFTYRSWEFLNVETKDLFDSFCCSIIINIYNNKIYRVLPKESDFINEDWITNKTRYAYAGLYIQRLISPIYSIKFKGFLLNIKCSWLKIFKYIGLLFIQNFIEHIYLNVGVFVDINTILTLKNFFFDISSIFSVFYCKNIDFKNHYVLNENLENLEKLDGVILLGFNPRLELPLFNLKLRKNYINTELVVYTIGLGLTSLTYFVENIGNFFNSFLKLSLGLIDFCQELFLFKKLKFFFGVSLLARVDFNNCLYVLDLIKVQLRKENIWSIVVPFVGLLNTFEIGLLHENINVKPIYLNSRIKYMCGDFEINFCDNVISLYQGIYGDLICKNKIVALPALSFVEKNGIYLNIEGLYNINNKLLDFYGKNAREDQKILKALSLFIKTKLFKFHIWNLNSFVLINKLNFKIVIYNFYYYLKKKYKDINSYKELSLNNLNMYIYIFFFIFKFNRISVKFMNLNIFELVLNYYASDIVSVHSSSLNFCAKLEKYVY